jgi:hypothetical protein
MYLTHPVMVYDIMRRMGETDEALLAACLTHDVLENNEAYKNDHDLFVSDLYEAAKEEGMSQMQAAREVYPILCMSEEVKNPDFYIHGSKLFEQVDRAAKLDTRSKKLKIGDQMASLICNLTYANDLAVFPPGMSRERGFTKKAWTLVDSIIRSTKGKPQEKMFEPWENMFAIVLLNVQHLLATHTREEQDAVRNEFDYDRLFNTRVRIEMVHVPKIVEVVNLPYNNDGVVCGMIRVDLDEKGNVVSYALRVDEGSNRYRNVAELQSRFELALQEKLKMSSPYASIHATPATPTPDGKATHERTFVLSKGGRHVFPFSSAARSIGLLNHHETDVIENRAAALELTAKERYRDSLRRGRDTAGR